MGNSRQDKTQSRSFIYVVPFWHGGDDARLVGQRVSDYICLQAGATPTTSLPTCSTPSHFPVASGQRPQNKAAGQWSLLWRSADWMWFPSRAAIARWNVPSGGLGGQREWNCVKLCVADWGLCQVREEKKHKNTHVENQTPGQSPSLSHFLVYLGHNAGPHQVPHTQLCDRVTQLTSGASQSISVYTPHCRCFFSPGSQSSAVMVTEGGSGVPSQLCLCRAGTGGQRARPGLAQRPAGERRRAVDLTEKMK